VSSAAPALGRERDGLGELVAPYLLGTDAAHLDQRHRFCAEPAADGDRRRPPERLPRVSGQSALVDGGRPRRHPDPAVRAQGRHAAAPGLGFEIDRTALRRFGKRLFAMGERGPAWFAIRRHGLRAALEIRRNRRAH
jgi:hypothetical protein